MFWGRLFCDCIFILNNLGWRVYFCYDHLERVARLWKPWSVDNMGCDKCTAFALVCVWGSGSKVTRITTDLQYLALFYPHFVHLPTRFIYPPPHLLLLLPSSLHFLLTSSYTLLPRQQFHCSVLVSECDFNVAVTSFTPHGSHLTSPVSSYLLVL